MNHSIRQDDVDERAAIGYDIVAQDGEARAGVLTTRRGMIETPVFMPVGTLGTVKGTRFEALEAADLDARIILGNTYHLWLRPGAETISACGGLAPLHRLGARAADGLRRLSGLESGRAAGRSRRRAPSFARTLTAVCVFLSPEVSMQVQAALGSDIVMAFDECAPGEARTRRRARAWS